MKSWLIYKDVAPDSAESATVETESAADFSTPSILPQGNGGAALASFELNAWGLDGTYEPIKQAAYWSKALSDENGEFSAPPTVTILFDAQFTSAGITIQFQPHDYCTDITVSWYRNGNLLRTQDYQPDSDSYFCDGFVSNYDEIRMTFRKTALPYRSVKLSSVLFGLYRRFEADEARNISIVNETNLISASAPSSSMQWMLDSKSDVEYLFQFKQPIEAHNGDSLLGVYYVSKSVKTGKRLYNLTCQDAFGVLETIPFSGKKYDNQSAKALLAELIGNRFPLYITANDRTLSGLLMPGTLRDAVQQLLFAWGVCAATDATDGIRVFPLKEEESEIPTNRVFESSLATNAAVTKVNVTGHAYTQDASGSVELNGVKYADAQTVFTVINPLVTPSDIENVVEVTNATMVSPLTGQRTAKGIYNYYKDRNVTTSKIVWDGEKLGDRVIVPDAWGGTQAGHVERMDIKLSNTVVATCTVRQTRISEGNYFAGDVFAGEVTA